MCEKRIEGPLPWPNAAAASRTYVYIYIWARCNSADAVLLPSSAHRSSLIARHAVHLDFAVAVAVDAGDAHLRPAHGQHNKAKGIHRQQREYEAVAVSFYYGTSAHIDGPELLSQARPAGRHLQPRLGHAAREARG